MKDWGEFSFGLGLGACITALVIGFLVDVDIEAHKEAALPKHCRVGEKVLMTTAPHAELYECEANWVRK